MRRPIALIEDPESDLPETARATLQVLVDGLRHLDERIAERDAEIARRAREDETARRLMTIPGIGPLIATALATLAPPPEHFRRARDFAAWLGLTRRQHSTGGKQRLGATTRMGERSLRRLLLLGANSVIIKRHTHAAARPGTWLGGMLARVVSRKWWKFRFGTSGQDLYDAAQAAASRMATGSRGSNSRKLVMP